MELLFDDNGPEHPFHLLSTHIILESPEFQFENVKEFVSCHGGFVHSYGFLYKWAVVGMAVNLSEEITENVSSDITTEFLIIA